MTVTTDIHFQRLQNAEEGSLNKSEQQYALLVSYIEFLKKNQLGGAIIQNLDLLNNEITVIAYNNCIKALRMELKTAFPFSLTAKAGLACLVVAAFFGTLGYFTVDRDPGLWILVGVCVFVGLMTIGGMIDTYKAQRSFSQKHIVPEEIGKAVSSLDTYLQQITVNEARIASEEPKPRSFKDWSCY